MLLSPVAPASPPHLNMLSSALPRPLPTPRSFVAREQRQLMRAIAAATLPHIQAAGEDGEGSGSEGGCTPAELVQLAVGFTKLGYYPGRNRGWKECPGLPGCVCTGRPTSTCACFFCSTVHLLRWPSQLQTVSLLVSPIAVIAGAEWMRAHRAACIALQPAFGAADLARLRAAYRALLDM